jgi:hypothetical protein
MLNIIPNGGTYIYSACEAFNEETEIDFKRLWHWLKRFNITSCGFSFDENGFHALRNAITLRAMHPTKTSPGPSIRSTLI